MRVGPTYLWEASLMHLAHEILAPLDCGSDCALIFPLKLHKKKKFGINTILYYFNKLAHVAAKNVQGYFNILVVCVWYCKDFWGLNMNSLWYKDMLEPRKLITYHIGRYFSFQWVRWYKNTLKLYHLKYWSIPEYTKRTGEYQSFRPENKNRLEKKNENEIKKWRTKFTSKWPTSSSPHEYTKHTGEYRSFRPENKNPPEKKNKNEIKKWRTKFTGKRPTSSLPPSLR